jgi:hypothetical protein
MHTWDSYTLGGLSTLLQSHYLYLDKLATTRRVTKVSNLGDLE